LPRPDQFGGAGSVRAAARAVTDQAAILPAAGVHCRLKSAGNRLLTLRIVRRISGNLGLP